ncbi:MAG: helix-turn-helix domain-containing protein [Albidovulum sp.]|nr:helix-turn-helix domain-containing protein [Albidovulum sp.]
MRVVQSAPSCPVCGGEGIKTTWSIHEFDYGNGEPSVELQARVPVRQCGACEFEYLDEEAERLKHIAVCDHFGVLPPDEIRRIREDHGMTRAAFAHASGLGEASLNRWENGLSIQTHANDRYLRLLAHPEIMSRLQKFTAARLPENRVAGVVAGRFRVVEVTDVLRKEQAAFRLCRVALRACT